MKPSSGSHKMFHTSALAPNQKQVSVYMFTGQGSQHSKMFQDFSSINPSMKSNVTRSILFGEDVSEANILKAFQEFKFPIFDRLNVQNVENPPTSLAQPLILLQSIMLFNELQKEKEARKLSENVLCMLGHSLGEFTAMAASGGLSVDDALNLVHIRGKSMESHVNKEMEQRMAMQAIINIPNQLMADIEKYLITNTDSSGLLGLCCDMANINTPQQVVLSGDKADIEKQIKIWQENYKCKLRSVPLNVHLPFHSKYLKGVSEDLRRAYSTMNTMQGRLSVPIVCNINGTFVDNMRDMVEFSIEQVYKPVLWNISMKNIIEHVLRNKNPDDFVKLRFIEIGPQKKLEPMVSKCCAGTEQLSIESFSITSLKDVTNYLESN